MRLLAILFVASALFAPLARAENSEIKPTEKGYEITSKALGKLILTFPTIDVGGKTIKPETPKSEGNSIKITYSNGSKLDITRTAPGVFSYRFHDLKEDVSKFRFEMKIPIKLAGKSWSIDSESGELPKEYADKPMLFQGSAKRFSLKDEKNTGFAVTIPFGFQQLQDSREWKTNEFVWFVFSDMPKNESNEANFEVKISPTPNTK